MKLFKKDKKKETITQANLEESREVILAKGKKFKYPFQYAKHRVVINTVMICVVVLVAFTAVGWAELYKVQSTSEVAFRFTKVLGLPVASVDGHSVKYSDYLMLYRSSLQSIEYQQGALDKSEDSDRQRQHYKRQALSLAEDYAYAMAKLEEAGIKISDEEIDEVIENHRSIGGERRSDEAFKGIVRNNFNLSIKEYRRLVLLSLAKKKYSSEFDDTAKNTAHVIHERLLANGGDMKAALTGYVEDGSASYESVESMVEASNLDGGRAAKAMTLANVGDISEPFVSRNGDGYYIVKLTAKEDTALSYESIWVRFVDFDVTMAKIREEGKVKEYIELASETDGEAVEPATEIDAPAE